MKTPIKITLSMALLLFTYTAVSAQQTHNPNLIPYSQFAPDTMAYLRANFESRDKNCFYDNRPIKELLDDLAIPVTKAVIQMKRGTKEIYHVMLHIELPQDRISGSVAVMLISLQTSIKPEDGEPYRRIIDRHPFGYQSVFDDEFQSMIEPLIIGEIRFSQEEYYIIEE